MKLAGGRKTKTGAWSTDVDVLEEVAAQGHDDRQESAGLARPGQAARHLYRRAARLHQSQDRPRAHLLCDGVDLDRAPGLHRSQSAEHSRSAPRKAAASARPSSRAKGNKLISADYSQIELRLLAHIADIPQLKKAFADNLDIHAMTASEIFGVPVKDMPAEVRRRAKAINFGIVYGISGFGLANQLGIARRARPTITSRNISPRFPGIRDYMEDTKQFARDPRLCRNPVRAAHPYPRDQFQDPGLSRRRRARRHQCADPGRGRRHHPPRHGARCPARWRRRSSRRGCCCRCMTN